jgi:hypothetical protein
LIRVPFFSDQTRMNLVESQEGDGGEFTLKLTNRSHNLRPTIPKC